MKRGNDPRLEHTYVHHADGFELLASEMLERLTMPSFARDPGNVWTNPELTCQHVDPERSLPHNGSAAAEVRILIFKGSLDDALRKVRAQRLALK